jgi:hypothetical protein
MAKGKYTAPPSHLGAPPSGIGSLEDLDDLIPEVEMIPQLSQILFAEDGGLLYMLDDSIVYAE